MEANTMFLATIISIRSESNVLTNCRKNFSAMAMSLSAEVQCIMTSSGKSNPINHNKTLKENLIMNTNNSIKAGGYK